MMDVLQYDNLLPVSWRGAPRTFVSLMTLYESNYIRFRQLVTDWNLSRDEYVSRPPSDCPLRLQVEERGRYTTTLTLTYLFATDGANEGGQTLTEPDLKIRIYHDARLVEALRAAPSHRHQLLTALRRQVARELNDRWRRNIMLNKWLDYCDCRGHVFRGD